MNKFFKLSLILFLTIAVLAFQTACSDTAVPAAPDTETKEYVMDGKTLTSHYIDVGQGDCTFIELPDSQTLLIDSGEREYADTVISYIKTLGYNTLDYVVATHPHVDHIGGMEAIISAFEVDEVYMPEITSVSTSTYISLLEKLEYLDITVTAATQGVVIADTDTLHIEFIAPMELDEENQNNSSAVLKIDYKSVSFLYMGDAETEVEMDILDSVSCDVVKVGHHGSKTSSSQEFVESTGARFAIVSVGADNMYGHPASKVISSWEAAGAEVYRTDLCGTIIVSTDGKDISVNTNRFQQSTPIETDSNTTTYNWVLNTNTKKIHKATCRYASEMLYKNVAHSKESVSALEAKGYSPCGVCKPHD